MRSTARVGWIPVHWQPFKHSRGAGSRHPYGGAEPIGPTPPGSKNRPSSRHADQHRLAADCLEIVCHVHYGLAVALLCLDVGDQQNVRLGMAAPHESHTYQLASTQGSSLFWLCRAGREAGWSR